MAKKPVVRNGYLKMWRLGPIEFGDQSRWSHRAPKKRGMWAFPYPFYNSYFTHHRYRDLLPKNLKEAEMEEQDEWIKKVGRKVLPIREFWYKGDLFTHFTPSGIIGDSGLFDSNDIHWSLMHSSRFASFIVSTHGDRMLHRFSKNKPVELIRSTVDHLEVFLAPHMGQIRDRM